MLLRLALIPIWIGALWGSLQLHRFDLDIGHGICGVWGCGPPIEALFGFHGFWFSLILPAAAYLGSFVSAGVSRRVGLALMLVGLVGITAFVGWDALTYAQKVGSTEHLLQRGFFVLVTTVDVPMIQTLVAGGLLYFVFGRTRAANDAEPAELVAVTESGSPFAAS